MTLLVDAGCLYAQADVDEPRHAAVVEVLDTERGPLVTTELAVAEADYLIAERLGVEVELAFLEDLEQGTFLVECLSRNELSRAREVVARYRDLRLGLTDASLIVLADRLGSKRMLTLDERHFRAVSPLRGGSFVLLPADAD